MADGKSTTSGWGVAVSTVLPRRRHAYLDPRCVYASDTFHRFWIGAARTGTRVLRFDRRG